MIEQDTFESTIQELLHTNDEFVQTLNEWSETHSFSNPVEALSHRAALISYYQHQTRVQNPTELLQQHETTIANPFNFLDFTSTNIDTEPSEISIHDAYQSLPTEQRLGTGEFYTPPWIASLLSEWVCNNSRLDTTSIIDPSVGTGRLLTSPQTQHVSHVTGVEIKPTPAILASIALQSHGFTKNSSSIRLQDFFDMSTENVFDGSIANPPYIRHENITNKTHVRSHLPETYTENGLTPINNRTDLYAYFLTKTTQLLRDGANIGWIIPSKWLIAEYGPSIKQFLLDHYDVHGIVQVSEELFSDALVDTVLVFATKNTGQSSNNSTSFISLNNRVNAQTLFSLLNTNVSTPQAYQHNNASQVVFPQSVLTSLTRTNWAQYVSSPPVALRIHNSDSTVPLEQFVNVDYGIKTGFNDFFILSQNTVNQYDIDARFIRPIIPTIRATNGYETGTSQTNSFILSIEPRVDTIQLPNNSQEAVDTLFSLGYTGVASYIENNEPETIPPSIQGERAWFIRDETLPSPIGFPLAFDTDHRVLLLDNTVLVSNRFASITPNYGVDVNLVHAVLNSWVMALEIETQARVTGGGAINFACRDIESLNIIDLQQINSQKKNALIRLSHLLCDNDTNKEQVRNDITNIVLEEIGVDVDCETIKHTTRALMRKRRGEQYTLPETNITVSIETPDTQSTLDGW